jgi:hypothetical protein
MSILSLGISQRFSARIRLPGKEVLKVALIMLEVKGFGEWFLWSVSLQGLIGTWNSF